jgi:hypothetical protein
MQKLQGYKYAVMLFGLSIYIAIRLLPVLTYPISAYGYDYGFYLYAVRFSHLSLALLTGLSGGYSHPLFVIIRLLHIPAVAGLNVLMLLAALSVGTVFYFVFDDARRGLWATVLAAFSVAQAEAYVSFLFKNEIGLLLLLLGIGFVLRRKRWPVVGVALGLLLLHRTTFIIFAVSLVAYFLYVYASGSRWKYWIWVLGTAIAALVGFRSTWLPWAQAVIRSPNQAVYEGIFLYGQNFWLLSLPLVCLGIAGAYSMLVKKKHAFLLVYLSICVLWVLCRLPFYNRILVYADAGFILCAAYFVAETARAQALRLWFAFVCIAAMVTISVWFNISRTPLIAPDEVQEIQSFKTSPGNFVVALSADDAPWLLGYLPSGVRLAAPGLFEDKHTLLEWQQLWSGTVGDSFFASLPRPLFLYSRSFPVPSGLQACVRQVSKNFSQVTCP